MTTDRVMLLIDADNVSGDVIEQAVAQLLQDHGALHVRRAYCTAESAVTHQQMFKRLSIKPMVNLAAGKNSTDIALAVDAVDLVLAERPEVVVIASSDSDFAPLVSRLREKGCRVLGIGQKGKVGDETRGVYDGFTDIEHRKPSAVARATPSTSNKPAAPARKTTRRKVVAAPVAAALPAAAHPPLPDKVREILAAMPELLRGETLELRVAAERLRDAGLLSKSGSSTRFFAPFADRFELVPERNPNKVRARDPQGN